MQAYWLVAALATSLGALHQPAICGGPDRPSSPLWWLLPHAMRGQRHPFPVSVVMMQPQIRLDGSHLLEVAKFLATHLIKGIWNVPSALCCSMACWLADNLDWVKQMWSHGTWHMAVAASGNKKQVSQTNSLAQNKTSISILFKQFKHKQLVFDVSSWAPFQGKRNLSCLGRAGQWLVRLLPIAVVICLFHHSHVVQQHLVFAFDNRRCKTTTTITRNWWNWNWKILWKMEGREVKIQGRIRNACFFLLPSLTTQGAPHMQTHAFMQRH